MYICSCVDYALHYTACKHAHLVHVSQTASCVNEGKLDLKLQEVEADSRQPLMDLQTLSCCSHVLENLRKAVTSKSAEVQFLVNSVDNIDTLRVASQHLSNAISVWKSLSTNMDPPKSFPTRKRPAPNAKMDCQVRFFSTKKKRAL